MIGDVSRAKHIYIVCGYTDMRKAIDGLTAIVQQNFGFRKINRVNAIIAKFLTILKLQPNRATLRSGLTQAVR